MKKDTLFIQNIVSRLSQEIFLNVENPSQKTKKQFAKVQRTLNLLCSELDSLNDTLEPAK